VVLYEMYRCGFCRVRPVIERHEVCDTCSGEREMVSCDVCDVLLEWNTEWDGVCEDCIREEERERFGRWIEFTEWGADYVSSTTKELVDECHGGCSKCCVRPLAGQVLCARCAAHNNKRVMRYGDECACCSVTECLCIVACGEGQYCKRHRH
jgi:hypothetical protein